MLKFMKDFSDKLSKFNESGQNERCKPLSNAQILQQKINIMEKERKQKLSSILNSYMDPFSRDIEEDEENLQKAYELFLAVFEANEKTGSGETRLLDFSIKSPLCAKDEYVSKNHFSFLLIWFMKKNNNCCFVPQIVPYGKNGFCLRFIDKDLYSPSAMEKELMSILDFEE